MGSDSVLTAFVVITALAFVVQAVVMAGMFFVLRGVHSQIEDIRRVVDQRIEPLTQSLTEILVDSHEPIQRITTNFSEISQILRQRTDQADLVLAELLERSRLQIIHLDQLISSLVDRVDSTARAVERSVVAPLREVSAVAAGVRAGLEFLRARRAGARARAATEDEEMFI